jgi:23S rRNA (pseudouridine1915-N3)-methyltransferase
MERILIVAVAAKLPAWAAAARAGYLGRLPRAFAARSVDVKAEPRPGGKSTGAILAAEAARIRAALPRAARVVALDERGTDLTTAAFAAKLRGWIDAGDPVAFVIGGADGLDEALKRDASARIRLSSLTLPHALAQVLLCEQLYRAASLLAGHPYHRA